MVASGPVRMRQFDSSLIPGWARAPASPETARAEGSVLTVRNSTLAALAPRSASAWRISAANTGQMSSHGPLKKVSTTTLWVSWANVVA